MKRPLLRVLLLPIGVLLMSGRGPVASAGDLTLETATDPGANSPDEPLADGFSLDRAVDFLDSAALTWQKQRKCFTCHTNYAYLYARPMISPEDTAHQTVRSFAKELIDQRWEEHGPRWDAEVVATAAALAFNDRVTTGHLSPEARQALDRIWTLQREDGGITWINCGWPPMESDDHYGVTLAALAVGSAPDDYAQTAQAREGIAGLRRYFEANPAPTLHHRMMLVWAAQSLDDLVPQAEQQQVIDELRSLQHEDGGWALADLGNWERADGSPQDTQTSDGYGTGFVVYLLRQAGVPSDDPAIERGISWLKSHQRQSGRWFTRSLHQDSKHFITNAGTAFAVMAIASCENTQSE